MAHIKAIGLENFRVFKEKTDFEFAPITVLTGSNNSGKSSVIKALLLLRNNVTTDNIPEYLDFNGPDHFLGTFESVLNDLDKDLVITIPFKWDNPVYSSWVDDTTLSPYPYAMIWNLSLTFEKNTRGGGKGGRLRTIHIYYDKTDIYRDWEGQEYASARQSGLSHEKKRTKREEKNIITFLKIDLLNKRILDIKDMYGFRFLKEDEGSIAYGAYKNSLLKEGAKMQFDFKSVLAYIHKQISLLKAKFPNVDIDEVEEVCLYHDFENDVSITYSEGKKINNFINEEYYLRNDEQALKQSVYEKENNIFGVKENIRKVRKEWYNYFLDSRYSDYGFFTEEGVKSGVNKQFSEMNDIRVITPNLKFKVSDTELDTEEYPRTCFFTYLPFGIETVQEYIGQVNEYQSEIEAIEARAIENISKGECSFKGNSAFLDYLYKDIINDVFFIFVSNNGDKTFNTDTNYRSYIDETILAYDKLNNISESFDFIKLLYYEVIYQLFETGLNEHFFIHPNDFFTKSETSEKISFSLKDSVDYEKTIIKEIRKYFKETYDDFSNILKLYFNSERFFYLPSSRGELSRFLSKDMKFESLIRSFLETDWNKDAEYILKFVEYWIKEFGFADELVIENVEGAIHIVKFVKNGKSFNIADMGFGVTQVLPIILKVAMIAYETRVCDMNNPFTCMHQSVLVVEEPELSLHPRLQSKLADMFVHANGVFAIQFIVETHSEYLIRKLQYLTGKKILKPEDTAIYYFFEPDKVPADRQQVERIWIEEDGRLGNEFGEGFFDEATHWMMELYKINNPN